MPITSPSDKATAVSLPRHFPILNTRPCPPPTPIPSSPYPCRWRRRGHPSEVKRTSSAGRRRGRMLGAGLNLVTTVVGFGMSATFIVFVCTRLICARARPAGSRASPDSSPFDLELRSDLDQPEHTIHGLEPVAVAAFPTIAYNREAFGSRGDHQCSICLAEYQEKETLRIMPACGHDFHVTCIDVWLQKQSTCPICRLSLHDSFESKDVSSSLYGGIPQMVDSSEVSIDHSCLPHRNEQSEGSANTLQIDGAVRVDMEVTEAGLPEHSR